SRAARRSPPSPYTPLFRSLPTLERARRRGESGVADHTEDRGAEGQPDMTNRADRTERCHAQGLPLWSVLQISHGARPSSDPKDRSEEHTSELQSRENLVCR